ncbi:MAG: dTMP kinase [Clostridiales bacterium]|nr:dTMP kinase [Clostridiales bacterium]
MRGKFITLEGCDGCGKSTQIEMLKSSLASRNARFVFTREPGGTEISERIREIISSPAYTDMDMYTELLLYAAARRQHSVYINKQLDEGKLVFCDRFTHSTIAYQGYGRGVDREVIDFCNKIALGDLKIDLTLFFDLSPEDAFKRKGGVDKSDRMECENFDFYTRVYNGYKVMASDKSVVTIDAKASATAVHESVLAVLEDRGIL